MKYEPSQAILLKEYKTIYYILQKNACSTIKSQIIELLGMEKTAAFPKDLHSIELYPFEKNLSITEVVQLSTRKLERNKLHYLREYV